MHIDLDTRLDKEYPEPPQCEVNDQDCSYGVDNLCHECGKKMCADCAIGVRHQPHLSKYTYETEEGTERIQQHCPDCIDSHEVSGRILGLGFGAGALGLLLAIAGTATAVSTTVVGLVLFVAGLLVLRHEYRLKALHNPNYGLPST